MPTEKTMAFVPAPDVIAPFVIVQAYVAPAPAFGTEAARPVAFWQVAAGAVIVAEGTGFTVTVALPLPAPAQFASADGRDGVGRRRRRRDRARRRARGDAALNDTVRPVERPRTRARQRDGQVRRGSRADRRRPAHHRRRHRRAAGVGEAAQETPLLEVGVDDDDVDRTGCVRGRGRQDLRRRDRRDGRGAPAERARSPRPGNRIPAMVTAVPPMEGPVFGLIDVGFTFEVSAIAVRKPSFPARKSIPSAIASVRVVAAANDQRAACVVRSIA